MLLVLFSAWPPSYPGGNVEYAPKMKLGDRLYEFNSLVHKIFMNVLIGNFQANLVIDGWDISCEIVLGWTSLDLTDEKFLVRVMLGTVMLQAIIWAKISLKFVLKGPIDNNMNNAALV